MEYYTYNLIIYVYILPMFLNKQLQTTILMKIIFSIIVKITKLHKNELIMKYYNK